MKRKANALSLCLAAALLLGLSQCKKQETPITPPTPEETEEGIHITLDVEDGSRHVVIPGTNTAVVNYSFGDKIYVGDGSKYIGTLTNTGSTGGTSSHFEGTILSPSSDRLHFYFVGGLSPLNDDEENSPKELSIGETSFIVNFSDQSNNLPVLSYGNAPYAADATSYTCMLMNKCALVKVGLLFDTESTVKLINNNTDVNIKTKASISFDHHIPSNPSEEFFASINPFTEVDVDATDDITLYSESGTAKWVILLPHNSEVTTSVKIGDKLYNNVKVPVIAENSYGSITYDACVPSSNFIYNCDYGVFSVNDDKLVRFSKGNLQYQPSSSIPTWRFADKQWHYVGGTNSENPQGSGTIEGSDNAKILDEGYTGWMDLFGWGTWGSNGNPLNISTDLEDYTWSEFTETLDSYNDWRTLSDDEWHYLLTERNKHIIIENEVSSVYAYAKKKCAFATVKGVKGIIILPDNWTGDFLFGETTVTNNGIQFGSSYTYTYSESEWDNNMKNKGAVFLPAAGNRTVTTETTTEGEPPTTTIKINEAGNKGYYWTSTTNSHKFVGFDISGVSTSNTTDDPNPTFGCSVRLVRDIE